MSRVEVSAADVVDSDAKKQQQRGGRSLIVQQRSALGLFPDSSCELVLREHDAAAHVDATSPPLSPAKKLKTKPKQPPPTIFSAGDADRSFGILRLSGKRRLRDDAGDEDGFRRAIVVDSAALKKSLEFLDEVAEETASPPATKKPAAKKGAAAAPKNDVAVVAEGKAATATPATAATKPAAKKGAKTKKK